MNFSTHKIRLLCLCLLLLLIIGMWWLDLPTTYAQEPGWQATNTTDAPAGRYGHTALSIDNKMLVWGGYYHLDNFLNDGYWYDPAMDSWTQISTVDAPIGRLRHTAIWTGEEVIVWGGESAGGGQTTNTGGRYAPVSRTTRVVHKSTV